MSKSIEQKQSEAIGKMITNKREKIEVLAKKTYQDPKYIYSNNIGGVICSRCEYISPDFEENCIKCGRRLTEV